MKRLMRNFLPACATLLLLLTGANISAAPQIKVVVQSATPSSGEQGTTELDVVIDGSGFDSSAAVAFLVSGSSTDTGDVVVRSVTYHSSNKLTARVGLTNAKLADYDIKVTLSSGRNGKGITLFKVVAKGGGNPDTTPPATIGDLEVMPTVRALALKFTTTGDDGNSGTALGYDVRYRTGTNCFADDPLSWIPAARSAESVAEAPGTIEYFNIRGPQGLATHGLAAGTSYCVAIRLLDEVNRSPQPGYWARAETATLAGDWTLTAIPVSTPGATAQDTERARAQVDPDDNSRLLMGWGTAVFSGANAIPGELRFASVSTERGSAGDGVVPECSVTLPEDCVETIPSSLWTKYFDTSSGYGYLVGMRPIPGPDKVAALYVRGVKAGSSSKRNPTGETGVLILERSAAGQWSVVGENNDGIQPLNDPAFVPFPVDVLGFAYAPDASGVFRPAVIWKEVVAATRTYFRQDVRYSERAASGWTTPQVLTMRENDCCAQTENVYRRIHLFNKPDGTLAAMVIGYPDQVHTVYAERIPGIPPNSWQWRHYLIDPRRNDNERIGFDSENGLMLVDALFDTSQVSVHGPIPLPAWSAETAVTPLPSHDYRTAGSPSGLGSWTQIYEDPTYSGRSVSVGGGYQNACGTAYASASFTHFSNTTGVYIYEQRVLTATQGAEYPTNPATDERVDATEDVPFAAIALPDGDRMIAYEWGALRGDVAYNPRPTNYLYLARSSTGCAPAP
jgi:hypothetical protein